MHRVLLSTKIGLFLFIIAAIACIAVLVDSCRSGKGDEARFRELLAKGKKAEWRADTTFPSCGAVCNIDSARAVAFDSAISILRDAVALNPGNAEAHYFLGDALWKKQAGISPGESIPVKTRTVAILASEQFELALRASPIYEGETNGMGPRGKIMSQWGALAMAYALCGREDSARWAMEEGRKRGGFSDAILEFAKNILLACDSNSILVTDGDLDSFPIWYLQLAERTRKDVLVVTYPLTLTSWFRTFLRNPAPFCLAGMEIDTTETAPVFTPSKNQHFFDVQIPIAPHPSFGIMVHAEGAPPMIKDADRSGSAVLRVKLFEDAGGTTGLLPHHQYFVNWLRNNAWRRPVIVSPLVEEEYLIGLAPYLRRIGIVQTLVPFPEKDSMKRVELAQSWFSMRGASSHPPYSFSASKDTLASRDPDIRLQILPAYLKMFNDVRRAVSKTGKENRAIASEILHLMWRELPVAYIEQDSEARQMLQEIGVQ